MNNEPVAFVSKEDLKNMKTHLCFLHLKPQKNDIPLYTHPVKEQKCVVQGCENHKHEGSFNGDLCSPCYQFIAHGKGTYSQAYRNTYTVKELTDEEIEGIARANVDGHSSMEQLKWFARAILRKAQEK